MHFEACTLNEEVDGSYDLDIIYDKLIEYAKGYNTIIRNAEIEIPEIL